MSDKQKWDERYGQNDLPWDTGRPDIRLDGLLSRWPKFSGRVLEVGCGTGSSAIRLAEHGFQVTALDIAPRAVEIARQRSAEKGAECTFLAADFLSCSLEKGQFTLVFDRGCFHSMSEEQRPGFVSRVAVCLEPGGIWLSIIGNRDQILNEQGPPRLSAAQICMAVEPEFEILHLESFMADAANRPVQLRFWQCLMRLRNQGSARG